MVIMNRATERPVTAVLGPTNTGKTHLAVERLCGHSSGMIGFPLRLLAREVYDRVVKIKGANQVALITGEEKIVPKDARWFLCTVESPIHQNIKEQIVRAEETDTALVLRRWRNTTRLYKNKVTEQALKVEQESKTGEFSEIAPFVSGKRGREVFLNGDPEYGVWTAGQVIGLIHDIPTCGDLIKRIEKEAEETLREKLSLFTPASKL